jgi:hypothetical protein
MKRPRYHYPAHLPPSALAMLAAQQARCDFSHMPEFGDILARVVAGQIEIDTSAGRSARCCEPCMKPTIARLA